LNFYLNKNFVDEKAYVSLSYCREVIEDFLKKIFENEKGKVVLTSGSTEAIFLALYYAREENKNISHPNIVIGENAHFSVERCAHFLKIAVKRAKITSRFTIDPNDVEKKIDKNTILIVGTMGSTELGAIDDFFSLEKIARRKGKKLHIDAAVGGFIIPFLKTNVKYKFSLLKSLYSLNISGHKYGLSLPGCGLLLVRDEKTIKNSSFSVSYFSSGWKLMDSFLVTRNVLGFVSLALNILNLGFDGYKSLSEEYLRIKEEIEERLREEKVEFYSGSRFIPQIFICPPEVNELSNYLREKGWIQSVYRPTGLGKEGIRLVVKYGQGKFLLNHFLHDLKHFFQEK